MTSKRPLVSAIIPVFNGERFLREAVESIRWQNYEPIEIIIVDDGSTDKTAEVASGLGDGIRYIYQENAGPSAARNRGITEAKGEIIGLLDADDQWPQGKLEAQISRLVKDPSVDVVGGRVQYVLLPGAKDPNIILDADNSAACMNVGSALYRRKVFDRIGLFDEALRFAEDHDWFLRAREQDVTLVILDQITVLYRLHDRNMTRDQAIGDQYFLLALKKSLDRRRRKARQPSSLKRWSDHDERHKPR